MSVPSRSQVTSGGRSVRPTEKKPGADVASASRAGTFNSPAFPVEDAVQLDAQLVVSVAPGTSLDVKLQTATDPTTPDWVDVPGGAFPQQAGTTTGVNRSFLLPGNVARWVCVAVGAAPTYAIDTQAVVRAV